LDEIETVEIDEIDEIEEEKIAATDPLDLNNFLFHDTEEGQ